RVLDFGARDGGDGASGAGEGEGRGQGGDHWFAGDAGDGGDGRGDVPQAPRRRAGWGQRGAVASWGGQGGAGARDGSGAAEVDHAAQEVQGECVHIDEGRGRSAHAVLQWIPAPVLLPDDGRDGSGDVARGSGDGDAWGQRGDGGGADHADRDGERASLRHP